MERRSLAGPATLVATHVWAKHRQGTEHRRGDPTYPLHRTKAPAGLPHRPGAFVASGQTATRGGRAAEGRRRERRRGDARRTARAPTVERTRAIDPRAPRRAA